MKFLKRLNDIITGLFLLLTWPLFIKVIAIYFPNGLEDFFDTVYKEMIGFKL